MSSISWDLEEIKQSPSIVAGLTVQQETTYRRKGCKIIAEVGVLLGLKWCRTLATACVYFHRFYMTGTFQEYPREDLALTCIFLAGKACETPKKCAAVCQAAVHCYPKIYSRDSGLDVCRAFSLKKIIAIEKVLLVVLNFELEMDLPYDSLLEYVKIFPFVSKENMDDVKQAAWAFINDSYNTVLCLNQEAQMITVVLLHLAFNAREVKSVADGADPCWWSIDIGNFPVTEVEKICHPVLDFYTETKYTPVLANNVLSP